MDVGGLLGNEAIRARLDAAAAQDRFSHSYLICGPDGSGKHTLANILAAAMQCTGAGRKPSRGSSALIRHSTAQPF